MDDLVDVLFRLPDLLRGRLGYVYHRDVGGGPGQMVDVAIYESVFNMMESSIAEYDKLGHIRERSGAKIEGIVPTSTYTCSDGRYIIIGANGDSIFRRLMIVIGRPDLATDQSLAGNDGRVHRESEIDAAIEAWTSERTYGEAYGKLVEADVPCGPIYSIKDIAEDEHYAARGVFDEIHFEDEPPVRIPAVLPFLSESPGGTDWPGPSLGEHNDEIYGGLLRLPREDLIKLSSQGVI